jgi:hypothetical protein
MLSIIPGTGIDILAKNSLQETVNKKPGLLNLSTIEKLLITFGIAD